MSRYKAIGVESKKVYARGDTRSECLRELTEKYPYPDKSKKDKDGKYINHVFPEVIQIK